MLPLLLGSFLFVYISSLLHIYYFTIRVLSSFLTDDNARSFFNPLPDDKILGLPKLKAFAEDKSDVTQNIKVGLHRIENIGGQKCWLPAFSTFPTMFSKGFFLQCIKSYCVVMG